VTASTLHLEWRDDGAPRAVTQGTAPSRERAQ
jgi:hypothetical protein